MFDIETEESELAVDGQRVDVYKNIQDECLSIKSAEPEGAGSTAETQGVSESRNTDSEDYGNVVGHADFVLLSDVEFVVQPAGQERARETGQKNVHAVVRGTVEGIGADGEVEWNMMVRMFGNDVCNVTYDPFESAESEDSENPNPAEVCRVERDSTAENEVFRGRSPTESGGRSSTADEQSESETDHFEVEGVPRVEEHDVAIGDPIYSAEYASVSEAGVGAMLRSLS